MPSRKTELATPLLAQETSGQTENSGTEILRVEEEEDQDGLGIKHIEYYRWSPFLWFLSVVGSIVTCGMLQLAFRWMPVFELKCKHRRCVPYNATHALITSLDTTQTVVPIQPAQELHQGLDLPRSLTFRHVRYFEHKGHFQPVVFECRQPYPQLLHAGGKGIRAEDVEHRTALFGRNLAEVPVKSHLALLLDEVLHPFYIFQVWSVVVWYLEPYILYATAIAVISIFSALVSLFSTRRNLLKIRDMASFQCQVKVLRQNAAGRTVELPISSVDLVPGDVVEIEDHAVFPCDIVLCAGSVVVNESMLTGESLPVLKTSLPLHTQSVYDPDNDKRFTLWAGTKALEARPFGKTKVTGIVLRTGFATAKGRLVRSILFPKPSNIKFYADSFKFVAVMSVMAVGGFMWSVQAFIDFNVELRDIILNACDIVTIAVPPALPAAMTIGTEFALERLKKASIFCISPSRVNIAGQLDTLCFDKTGTLTEDGVDVMGVLPADENAIHPLTEPSKAPQRLLECLAACHSLTSVNGELIGDPLDLKMFCSTGWTLHEPAAAEEHDEDMVAPPMVFPPGTDLSELELGTPEGGLAIVRRFDFTSNHQRMSVIARTAGERGSHVLLKGAPEVVRDLCDHATVPPDFARVVQGHTRQGLRLLACAHKYEKSWRWDVAHKATREKAEADLTFLGVLILENRLKPETAAVIDELLRARISCCMVTGDHVLTGVTVSRRCGLMHPTRPVYMAELASTRPHPPHPGHLPGERRPRRSSTVSSDAGRAQDDSAISETSSVCRGAQRGRSLSDANLADIEDLLLEEEGEEGDMEMYGIQELPEIDHRLTEENLRAGMPGTDLLCPSPRHSIASSAVQSVHSVEGMAEKTVDFHLLDDRDEGPAHVNLERMLEMLEEGAELELALTGGAFEFLHSLRRQGEPAPLHAAMERGRVFARMSPEQKQALVELYAEEHGRVVGMCGDGANDCGALKAAHVGLSLSDAEASIAAPFTSSIPNIRPLLQLMREGRAALVTSISCFKFMALYSAIQFITVLRLYRINTNMSDFQYLWIDLFVIFPLAVYMARTGPFPKLSVARPHGRLISLPVLSSVLGQTVIAASFQFFAAWWTLQVRAFRCRPGCPPDGGVCDPTAPMPACCAAQPLGCETRPIVADTDDNIMSVEATSAFLFSQFQYLAVVIAFNTSKPFRRSLVTNHLFFYSFLALALASSLLLLAPDDWLAVLDSWITTLEVQRFPAAAFKLRLFALALVNAAVTYAFECVVEALARRVEQRRLSLPAAVAAVAAVPPASLCLRCRRPPRALRGRLCGGRRVWGAACPCSSSRTRRRRR